MVQLGQGGVTQCHGLFLFCFSFSLGQECPSSLEQSSPAPGRGAWAACFVPSSPALPAVLWLVLGCSDTQAPVSHPQAKIPRSRYPFRLAFPHWPLWGGGKESMEGWIGAPSRPLCWYAQRALQPPHVVLAGECRE